MTQDRYAVLFEPVQIGPVTAPNRFYQVPHCSGMGWQRPKTLAAMRGTKAEGGWGVVCTEYCSVHPTSDDGHFPSCRLWDARDVKANALMTDAVHAHGALAGVELWLGGARPSNLITRLPAVGVSNRPSAQLDPFPTQTRRLDRSDIAGLRRWHKDAALRAVEAGFDIVYVYANHGYLLHEFLSSQMNDRTDEYGGSLENRARLVRELLEETKEAVGHKCAVACRFSFAPEEGGTHWDQMESEDTFALLSELPDLWDITVDDYDQEMGVSRFVKEGAQESYARLAKSMSSKPVVTVGRFTSPDTMLRMVKSGAQDFIGAARPSIADPFLPNKIRDGLVDEIRECIGCNICYAHNSNGAPIRCTQNPTMGEEMRRGWHPENIPDAHVPEKVLIVGGGPAGLEAARAMGQRGYEVTLAEAGSDPGGRVTRESRLPGLSEWARVRDWRVGRLQQMGNVSLYLESPLTADDVLGFGADHIFIATGATWRRDGIGPHHDAPIPGLEGGAVYSPDEIMNGNLPKQGPVLVYEDEHYYMASVIAERLLDAGLEVIVATPMGMVASWGKYTEEHHLSNSRLIEKGASIIVNVTLASFDGSKATLSPAFGEPDTAVSVQSVVPVTSRIPRDDLYLALTGDPAALKDAGIQSVSKIGDCDAPGIIAHAVYAGHKAARQLGVQHNDDLDWPDAAE